MDTGSDAAGPRVFIAPLESGCHQALVDASPELARDFWFVEHLVHRLLESVRTNDVESADYVYLPHYAMCEHASFLYRRGIDVARPGPDNAGRAIQQVNRTFRRAVASLRRAGLWSERYRSRYLLVFGQGRGAEQGRILPHFPELRAGRFAGVEARPPLRHTFRLGHDIVIPPHQAHTAVAASVRRTAPARTRLAHFRGRPWSPVRQAVVRALAGADPAIAIETERKYRLGGEGTEYVADEVAEYFAEMASAVFALCPAGKTAWTLRFYEAMQVGCIPVLIPGTFVPPFSDCIDYARCTLSVPLGDLERLPRLLRSIPDAMIADMLAYQAEVRHLLDWNAGAPSMLMRALGREP